MPKLVTQTRGSPTVTETSTPNGFLPAGTVAITAPSDGRRAVTVPLPLFATQIFKPSNAMPAGLSPTGMVLSTRPSLDRSFVTVPSWKFVTYTQEDIGTPLANEPHRLDAVSGGTNDREAFAFEEGTKRIAEQALVVRYRDSNSPPR